MVSTFITIVSFLCIALVNFTTFGVAQQCEYFCGSDDWATFSNQTSGQSFAYKAFTFAANSINYWQALAFCTAQGAQVASIHSREENEFILSLLPANTTVLESHWIGLHRFQPDATATVKSCEWDDGSACDFGNVPVFTASYPWFTGTDGGPSAIDISQPGQQCSAAAVNTGSCLENCANIMFHVWNDISCNQQLGGVVCKKSCIRQCQQQQTTMGTAEEGEGDGTGACSATSSAFTAKSATTRTFSVGGIGAFGTTNSAASETTTTLESVGMFNATENASGPIAAGGGGDSGRPSRSSPSPLSCEPQLVNSWDGGAQYNLVFENNAQSAICSCSFQILVPQNISLVSSWNMQAASIPGQFTLPAWVNIAAGSSYSQSGCILSDGSTPPTVEVISTGAC